MPDHITGTRLCRRIKAKHKIVDQTGKNLSEALNLDDSTMMASTKMGLKMNLKTL